MKSIKILVSLFVFFTLIVFFAGVRLTVENQSGQKIQDVEIKYDRGIFLAGSISDKDVREKSLGKIGEGATFGVKWQENTGLIRQAQFNLYFDSFFGYVPIKIIILPDGEAILYEGEQQHLASAIN